MSKTWPNARWMIIQSSTVQMRACILASLGFTIKTGNVASPLALIHRSDRTRCVGYVYLCRVVFFQRGASTWLGQRDNKKQWDDRATTRRQWLLLQSGEDTDAYRCASCSTCWSHLHLERNCSWSQETEASCQSEGARKGDKCITWSWKQLCTNENVIWKETKIGTGDCWEMWTGDLYKGIGMQNEFPKESTTVDKELLSDKQVSHSFGSMQLSWCGYEPPYELRSRLDTVGY